MNLIFGMKVIYLMRLDSLVKIVVERCTRNTTKVPTVWNINYQIIKNNNTTTQKKASGCFSPMLFLRFFGDHSQLLILFPKQLHSIQKFSVIMDTDAYLTEIGMNHIGVMAFAFHPTFEQKFAILASSLK